MTKKLETSGDIWRRRGFPIVTAAKKVGTFGREIKRIVDAAKAAKTPPRCEWMCCYKNADDQTALVLVLPHPHWVTEPNARTTKHKFRSAKIKADRELAQAVVLAFLREPLKGKNCWPRVKIDAQFIGRSSQSDKHNLEGWLKYYIDGISHVLNAGQDHEWEFGEVTCEPARGRAKCVVLTVTRLS